MTSFEEIQQAYIAELRSLQPELIVWWKNLAGISELGDPVPADISNRWPTGYSGHPRVLAVFRKYYFQFEELNLDALDSAAEPLPHVDAPELWRNPEEPDPLAYRRPVDLLILDIETLAPDIHKLVAGIVFVPVGLNQFDEAV